VTPGRGFDSRIPLSGNTCKMSAFVLWPARGCNSAGNVASEDADLGQLGRCERRVSIVEASVGDHARPGGRWAVAGANRLFPGLSSALHATIIDVDAVTATASLERPDRPFHHWLDE